MLTVLDLSCLLPAADTSQSQSDRNPATHLIALRGDEQLAIAVPEVHERVEISADALYESPETTGTLGMRIFEHEGVEILVLDPKELFSTAIQGRERRRRRF
jgi:hypothetical protein